MGFGVDIISNTCVKLITAICIAATALELFINKTLKIDIYSSFRTYHDQTEKSINFPFNIFYLTYFIFFKAEKFTY